MALKIRLARGGAKKRPFYRIVVAEGSSPRDGRFVEKLGTYNPLLPHDHAERVVMNVERIKYWMSVGAQPSERVTVFLSKVGLAEKKARTPDPKKSAPKAKAQERAKAAIEAAEAAKQAAAEAAASPAPAPVEEAPAPVEEAPAAEEPVAVEEPAAPAQEEAPTPSEEEAPAAE